MKSTKFETALDNYTVSIDLGHGSGMKEISMNVKTEVVTGPACPGFINTKTEFLANFRGIKNLRKLKKIVDQAIEHYDEGK